MLFVSFLPKSLENVKRQFWDDPTLVRWLRDTWRMLHFVRKAPQVTVVNKAKRAAAIITPWFGSPVPWFSITVGLLLAGRGYRVTFVLDDQLFGNYSRIWQLQLSCLRAVLAVIGRRCSVLRLSDFSTTCDIDHETRAAIDRLAYLNAVWVRKGETGIDTKAMRQTTEQLVQAQRAITTLLDRHPQDLLFVPGGICATSGLWLRSGRSRGIRVSTFDSGGYGVLLLAADGIACQLSDIPRAYAALRDETQAAEERRLVIEYAEEEISKRRSGNDKFSSQIKGAAGKRPEYEGGVLIALNSPWDSAALGLHEVFETTQDWIVQTARYLLEHSDVPVLVRQHPIERLPIARSVDDTRALLHQHFGDHPRLHFIGAEDQVNSYDLMEQVAAVVVYTSTVGVEAVAHGRLVITEAASYYADLGFVLKATTAQAYFSFLADAIAGRRTVTPVMREDALCCYYITQCCNWMQTSFTVPDFPAWSRQSFDELNRDVTVNTVINTVISDTPVSLLNHHLRWASLGRVVANGISHV
jgi:hypothetical protein